MTMISNGPVNVVQRAYGKTANNIKYGTALAATGAAILAINKDSAVSQKVGNVANTIWSKISPKLAKTKIGEAVGVFASKVGVVIKPVTSKVAGLVSRVKDTGIFKKVAAKVGPYMAKIPFKPVATVAALLFAAKLIHDHGRNSGKIDQRYQDKQIFVRGFDLTV